MGCNFHHTNDKLCSEKIYICEGLKRCLKTE
uniref:Uncharacterized protein n=1 Tax=Rhizophora mucronata TaxID=61149 RepID=A0A2P2NCY7_RHIMU